MRRGPRSLVGCSPHEAKRNPGAAIPDFASLHPGYGRSIVASLYPLASRDNVVTFRNHRRIPSAMTVALSPASADPAQGGGRAPWLTRERWTAIRRPLTTLVVGVAGWEILSRAVLPNRLFFVP